MGLEELREWRNVEKIPWRWNVRRGDGENGGEDRSKKNPKGEKLVKN